MYFPEGLNLGEAVQLTELINTAYDMQSQWKQQGKPRRPDFQWTPKGPDLNYGQPLWGSDRFLYFIQEEEPFAFVATGADHLAYLVFRGTDSDADWVENLKFDQVDYSHAPDFGKVNMGFNGIYSSMSADILQALATIESPHRIFITGHSLGSSLSTLAVPDIVTNLPGVEAAAIVHCNFASPRTGDPVFASAYNACAVETFRLVNTCDIVPNVPASVITKDLPIYKHVGIPVDFTAQYCSIPANHDITNSYGYALQHPQQPEGAT
jgi:hypothetical protein